MNFTDQNNCYKPETDLFTLPPTQLNVEEGSWHAISPLTGFEEGNIEFMIAATDEYIDLNETELYIKVSIQTNSNTKEFITDANVVGPTNNLMHTMIDQVVLTLNNVQIENSNGSYPYRAYIENNLNY